MRVWQQSLTTKNIANYFLILALIVVGVVGGVAHLRAREALKQAAFNRLSVAATLKEEEINRWFEDQQRDFLLISQLPEVKSKLEILLAQNKSSVEEKKVYTIISQYLIDLAHIKPNLREILILDRSNKILLSTNKEREDQYEILANITYVDKVELGDDFSPIFYVSPITGKPAVTLAKPIRNKEGERIGMVMANLNLERIDRIVRERTGLGNSGETYLVGSLVSKNTFISREPTKTKEYPQGISSQGIDNAMSGISGYGLYENYAGVDVIGVYRWLNDQDLALIVEMSQKEAFAPARQLASTIILVGLVSVVGLLIGVNWLSRQLEFSRHQLEEYSHQLEIKAEEAETANLAKSVFLANMSHELRTPLNAILGFAQLMERDSSLKLQQQESLAIINRSGEHLLNLINDVLEMSKIEAGRTVINPEPFDLHRLLQTLQEMFQIRTEEKQLAFNFIIDHNLPRYIISDSRKLRQVIINLLSNAVKFTQIGGVTLRVSLVMSQEATPKLNEQEPITIYFEVSDTGKGIAPEELGNLFQPFVQTTSGMEAEGGTGLGLAISRQFVKLMGGEIEANSTLGKGSTFSFTIGALAAADTEIEAETTKKRIISLASNQIDYRILVVDDRQANRQLLVQLLESVGFTTRTANNGKEAISLWQQWQPHLIWMDMQMPVMDGYAATKNIKQQPEGKNTIIIALTASAFEEQRNQILATGCDDFVSKPFSEQVIFEKMAKHLEVKYIYQAESLADSSQEISQKEYINAEDLNVLSSQWLRKLQQAAITVDAELIFQLIEEIAASYPAIAQNLSELTRNYDFDRIIQLTENLELVTEDES